jgi:hypothetical protein
MVMGTHTWREVEHFDPAWMQRIKEMARYIPSGSTVMDLGCGRMWLREFLHGNPYYPVDYTHRGNGTIVCDFNKKEFPDQRADVAFVSGTLEYVADPQWFVARVARQCNQCVISYCLLEDYPDLQFRREKAWVNNFRRDEVVSLFSAEGFALASESQAVPKNRIFHFLKAASTFPKPTETAQNRGQAH